jgi:hypothetical protein
MSPVLLGRTTNFEYDPYGRLTAVVQPEVADPEGLPGARLRPRTEYAYDVYGDLTDKGDIANSSCDRPAE